MKRWERKGNGMEGWRKRKGKENGNVGKEENGKRLENRSEGMEKTKKNKENRNACWFSLHQTLTRKYM